MRKEILVTGGAGYIGSHTVVALMENGFLPIVIDDFRNSNASILRGIESITHQKVIHYCEDLTDSDALQRIFEAHHFDAAILFGAYKSVGESVKFPLKYYKNNLNAMLSILELMEAHKVPNVIFSSSCTLYDLTSDGSVSETTDIGFGLSPYAATKRMGELIVSDTVKASATMRAVNLRYFNPIGAHPSGKIGELPQGIPNNLVPFITATATGELDELVVFGNDYDTEDGTCIRDYVHVCDIADAHVTTMKWLMEQNAGTLEVFNLGTGNGTSVLEIIETFERVNMLRLNWRFGKRRPGDREKIFANTRKSFEILGWHSKYSIEDALLHAWNWELSRKETVVLK